MHGQLANSSRRDRTSSDQELCLTSWKLHCSCCGGCNMLQRCTSAEESLGLIVSESQCLNILRPWAGMRWSRNVSESSWGSRVMAPTLAQSACQNLTGHKQHFKRPLASKPYVRKLTSAISPYHLPEHQPCKPSNMRAIGIALVTLCTLDNATWPIDQEFFWILNARRYYNESGTNYKCLPWYHTLPCSRQCTLPVGPRSLDSQPHRAGRAQVKLPSLFSQMSV